MNLARMTSARLALVASTLLFTAFAATAGPQQQQQSPFGGNRQTVPATGLPSSKGEDADVAAMQQRQVHARNDERQKRLVADTDKLLALATQLHDDVGKTDKNILSLDVVKRAEEIEKLAHNVKERMKG